MAVTTTTTAATPAGSKKRGGGGVDKSGGGATQSDRARLVEAAAAIVRNQDALAAAVEYMRTLCPTTIEKMDSDLAARRRDLDDFVAQQQRDAAQAVQDADNAVRQRRVELEQEFKTHAMARAIEVLRDNGKVAIDATELETLRARVDKIDDDRAAAIQQVTKRLEDEHAREMDTKVTRMMLENKAMAAEMQATSSHQKELVQQLKDQIVSLKQDIEAQRKLTADVASASRVVVESNGNVKH